jgi:uncharacterized membrane protein YfcA
VNDSLLLLLAFVVISAVYASVGHGGASGYLAIMALFSVPVMEMKPTALTLNLVVSCLGTVLFFRSGHFAWRLFWPFAAISIPFAFFGGRIDLTPDVFKPLVAVALAFAVIRLFVRVSGSATFKSPPPWAIVAAGASIGLLSGMIGVGGGIFLTPLLLICGWSDVKTAAAVSAPFIFVNSAAGLLGHSTASGYLISGWSMYAAAVLIGGFVGARWGSSFAKPVHMRPVLALVLAIAAAKLVMT